MKLSLLLTFALITFIFGIGGVLGATCNQTVEKIPVVGVQKINETSDLILGIPAYIFGIGMIIILFVIVALIFTNKNIRRRFNGRS